MRCGPLRSAVRGSAVGELHTLDYNTLRVALAQFNPVSGDIDGNAARITAAIDEARAAGGRPRRRAGAGAARLLHRRSRRGRGLPRGQRARDRSASPQAARGITAVVGFIDYDLHQRNDNGTVRKYNAAAVVRDGRVLQRAHKSLLPNYRYFDDKRFFTPGRVAASRSTCRRRRPLARRRVDLRRHVGRLLRRQAAARARRQGRRGHPEPERLALLSRASARRDALIRRHVARVRRPLVYVNTVGAADNGKNIIPFDGESLVYDGHGRLIAIGRQFEEDLLVVDLGRRAAARRRSSCRRSTASARCTTRW